MQRDQSRADPLHKACTRVAHESGALTTTANSGNAFLVEVQEPARKNVNIYDQNIVIKGFYFLKTNKYVQHYGERDTEVSIL